MKRQATKMMGMMQSQSEAARGRPMETGCGLQCGRAPGPPDAKNNLEKKKWICYAGHKFSTCQQRIDFLTSVRACAGLIELPA